MPWHLISVGGSLLVTGATPPQGDCYVVDTFESSEEADKVRAALLTAAYKYSREDNQEDKDAALFRLYSDLKSLIHRSDSSSDPLPPLHPQQPPQKRSPPLQSETALRYNSGKPELSHLLDFPRALEELCRIAAFGATKYGRSNWKKGGRPDSEFLDSALRHIFSSYLHETDNESGSSHLLHAAWNLLALYELQSREQE